MKNSEITIGSRVVAPMTDSDGEVQYVTGTLVSVNSRYAKIDLGDDGIINVGKSKIEALEAKKTTKKAAKNHIDCPHCGHTHELTTEIPDGDMDCEKCGEVFDNSDADRDTGRIAEDYEYKQVAAASGRTSCDNNDKVAVALRGKQLQQAYQIVAKIVGETQKSLKARYEHLNPGHQRMCLGNLLRGFYKRQEK